MADATITKILFFKDCFLENKDNKNYSVEALVNDIKSECKKRNLDYLWDKYPRVPFEREEFLIFYTVYFYLYDVAHTPLEEVFLEKEDIRKMKGFIKEFNSLLDKSGKYIYRAGLLEIVTKLMKDIDERLFASLCNGGCVRIGDWEADIINV